MVSSFSRFVDCRTSWVTLLNCQPDLHYIDSKVVFATVVAATRQLDLFQVLQPVWKRWHSLDQSEVLDPSDERLLIERASDASSILLNKAEKYLVEALVDLLHDFYRMGDATLAQLTAAARTAFNFHAHERALPPNLRRVQAQWTNAVISHFPNIFISIQDVSSLDSSSMVSEVAQPLLEREPPPWSDTAMKRVVDADKWSDSGGDHGDIHRPEIAERLEEKQDDPDDDRLSAERKLQPASNEEERQHMNSSTSHESTQGRDVVSQSTSTRQQPSETEGSSIVDQRAALAAAALQRLTEIRSEKERAEQRQAAGRSASPANEPSAFDSRVWMDDPEIAEILRADDDKATPETTALVAAIIDDDDGGDDHADRDDTYDAYGDEFGDNELRGTTLPPDLELSVINADALDLPLPVDGDDLARIESSGSNHDTLVANATEWTSSEWTAEDVDATVSNEHAAAESLSHLESGPDVDPRAKPQSSESTEHLRDTAPAVTAGRGNDGVQTPIPVLEHIQNDKTVADTVLHQRRGPIPAHALAAAKAKKLAAMKESRGGPRVDVDSIKSTPSAERRQQAKLVATPNYKVRFHDVYDTKPAVHSAFSQKAKQLLNDAVVVTPGAQPQPALHQQQRQQLQRHLARLHKQSIAPANRMITPANAKPNLPSTTVDIHSRKRRVPPRDKQPIVTKSQDPTPTERVKQRATHNSGVSRIAALEDFDEDDFDDDYDEDAFTIDAESKVTGDILPGVSLPAVSVQRRSPEHAATGALAAEINRLRNAILKSKPHNVVALLQGSAP